MSIFSFKKNKVEQRSAVASDATSATSLIFGQFLLSDSAATVSAFFAAVELISNSIAQLPILIKRDNQTIYDNHLNVLFAHTAMSKFNMLKQLIYDVIMYGNAVMYIKRAQDGTPIDLIYCEHGTYNIFYHTTVQ